MITPESSEIIKLAGFSIVQINEDTIKIYVEKYMVILPSSGNSIMIMNKR